MPRTLLYFEARSPDQSPNGIDDARQRFLRHLERTFRGQIARDADAIQVAAQSGGHVIASAE